MRGVHSIHWWCKTQDRIARSSAEAELKSTCKGLGEVIGLKQVVDFFSGVKFAITLTIDAQATFGLLLRQGAGALTHLDIRTLWIQEALKEWSVGVYKVPRKHNIADALCSVPTMCQNGTNIS